MHTILTLNSQTQKETGIQLTEMHASTESSTGEMCSSESSVLVWQGRHTHQEKDENKMTVLGKGAGKEGHQ